MLNIFKDIKAVGFDLDRTLYKENPQVAKNINLEIAKRVLEKKPGLKSIKKAGKFFNDFYKTIGSSTQVLRTLGFKNAEQVMYECLSNAEIATYLYSDPRLCKILKKLKEKYVLFLLTTKPSDLATEVLIKLGINPSMFEYAIFGDDVAAKTKVDGVMFRHFLVLSRFIAKEAVYIGDSLKADIAPAKKLGMLTIAVGEINEADINIPEIYDIEKLLL